MRFKSQVSLEYLLLIGIILMVLIPIFYFTTKESTSLISNKEAEIAINTIINTADKLYALGTGTKEYISITIPKGVTSTSVNGSTVIITIQSSDHESEIGASSKAQLIGYIPNKTGTYNIPLEVLDSSIVIIGESCTLNGICDASETCSTCPGDCSCSSGELCCTTCQANACLMSSQCDDGNICTIDICSDGGTCSSACSNELIPGCDPGNFTGNGTEAICGDNICNWWQWSTENCNTCPGDCLGENQLCCAFDPQGSWYYPSDGLECPAPTVTNCADLCVSLTGYISGVCRQNNAQCNNNGETWETSGDSYCLGGSTADYCCCIP